MFIAVPDYNRQSDDTIQILDTVDGTIERVKVSELVDTDVNIKNLYRHKNICSVDDFGFRLCLMDCNETGNYVRCDMDNNIYVGDRHVRITVIRGVTYVNNKKIIDLTKASLMYLFLYKDYLVLRFLLFTLPYQSNASFSSKYYTVAIRQDGTMEEWRADMQYCTNKALAMQIDMTLEV